MAHAFCEAQLKLYGYLEDEAESNLISFNLSLYSILSIQLSHPERPITLRLAKPMR